MEELNSVRAKWYDIGMQLGVSIGSLDGIKKQYNDPSDCLREFLLVKQDWLHTWNTSSVQNESLPLLPLTSLKQWYHL